jgi:heat shock protein HtpX
VTRFGLFFGGGDRDRGPAGGILAIAAIILAPIAAFMIQSAISRSREYAADAGGAAMSGKPRSLASALQKLEAAAQQIPMAVNPAAEHLYIVKPFRGVGIGRLFSSHPPTAQRVERLLELPTRA